MQGGSNMLTSLLPLIVLFAIFYFLVIRPQQKQAKQHKDMIAGLKKGDKVITNGGLICQVIKPEENFIKVSLNNEVMVKISREYIAKKIDE